MVDNLALPKTDKPIAVVTGGGAGIGAAICHSLASEGYFLLVLERNSEAGERVAEQIKQQEGEAFSLTLDISDQQAVERLTEQLPRVDVLVNNAGIFDVIAFEQLTSDDFRRMYDINVVALFHLTQSLSKKMVQGGAIVNIASRAMLGAKHYAHYVASKAAVGGLTRAMALELAERGIRVNAVAPGVIETDMLKARSDTNLDSLRAMQPTGELGEPKDIAEAVTFLASPKAKFITGQVLLVDGGRSLGGSLGI